MALLRLGAATSSVLGSGMFCLSVCLHIQRMTYEKRPPLSPAAPLWQRAAHSWHAGARFLTLCGGCGFGRGEGGWLGRGRGRQQGRSGGGEGEGEGEGADGGEGEGEGVFLSCWCA